MAHSYEAPGVYIKEVTEVPSVLSSVPTAVPVFFGVAEWGPEWTPRATTRGFENWTKLFGGRLAYSDLAYCVDHFFKEAQATGLSAGQTIHTVRQTKLNSDKSAVADDVVKASVELDSITTVARGATLLGTQSPSTYGNGWTIPRDTVVTLSFNVNDGTSEDFTADIVGYSASITSDGLTGDLTSLSTDYFDLRVEAGQNPIRVAFGADTYTAAEVVDLINQQIARASAELDGGGEIVITSDGGGTRSHLTVTACTATIATYLGWDTDALPTSGPATEGSNVADTTNVTIEEIKAIIEDITDINVTVATNLSPMKFNMTSVATGSTVSITFDDSSDTAIALARTVFGIPTTPFAGTNGGTAAAALVARAKYYGLLGNRLSAKPVWNPKRPSRKAVSASVDDLRTAVTAADAYFDVSTRFGYEVGMVLRFDDGTHEEWVTVNRIDAKSTEAGETYYRLYITSDNTVTGLFQYGFAVATTEIDSMEFDLYTYLDGVLEGTFTQLSVNSEADNYFDAVLQDDYSGSNRIVLEVASGASSYLRTMFPATLTSAVALTGATLETESDYSISLADFEGSAEYRTGMYAIHPLRFKASLVGVPGASAAKIKKMQAYLDKRRDLFQVAGIPKSDTGFSALDTSAKVLEWRDRNGFDSAFLGLYFPYVKVDDPIGVGRSPLRTIDPVGSLMGLYARVNAMPAPDGGPWAAAAGEGEYGKLYHARGLDYFVDDIGDGTGRNSELGELNVASVNCIVLNEANAVTVWGARTTSLDRNWRYIPVRLTATMLAQSILLGTRIGVFRANVPRWWDVLRNLVAGLADRTWRAGGLKGNTADEAYLVQIGIEDGTMTALDVEDGHQIGKVGFAYTKPSEFIEWNISQLPNGDITLT